MRLQTIYLINKDLPAHKQYKDPRELMKFKHDIEYIDPESIHIPTPEEWEEMDRRFARPGDQDLPIPGLQETDNNNREILQ
jgi:hypothetical protein